MSSQSDDKAIWRRLDEHSVKIDSMAIQQAETRSEVRSLERRLDRQMAEHGSVLSRIEAKLDSTTAYQERTKGARNFGAWLFGAGVALLTGIVAFYNLPMFNN